jgi:putative ABC transport system permease protein
MNFLQTVRIATRALLRNKMRSFLTTLGIIIGVAAVIAMVAIGEGASAQVEEQFAAMGTNLLIILPGSTTAGGARGGFGSAPTLTWDDLAAIREELPSTVRYAAPVLRTIAQVLSDDQNWSTSVAGTTPDYFDLRSWPMSRGARFTTIDNESGRKVVVLGQTVIDKLYGGNTDPIGQSVKIRNVPFEIVGVMAPKGQSAQGMDYDDVAYMPERTFRAKIQGGLGNYIAGVVFVAAVDGDSTQRAELQIRRLLRERHHIRPGMDDDFSIRNLSELANAQVESKKTQAKLLLSVAAVSLLVGGIGIMNIMLVSVTERTREIGIRMAVGAKPRDILAQFLLEALVLSIMGGLIGIAIGLIAAERIAASNHWPMLIRPDVIAVSVAFSAAVGIIFGLYPARKASRLDPIDALRYE